MNIFKTLHKQITSLGFWSWAVLVLLMVSILPIPVWAQTFSDFTLFPNVNTIGDVIVLIISVMTAIASPIAIFLIIIGGFQTMIGGSKESISQGIKKIVAASIGLGIILMASAIENLVQGTFYGGDIDIVFLVAVIQELLIRNATILSVAVATLAMIAGGYRDFLSSFDAQTNGTQAARNAIFGLAVIFLSGGLAQVITGAIDPEESNIVRSVENLVGSVGGTLESVISLMTVLSVILCILVIVKGGYDYFLSTITDKAKPLETIRNGVTGLAITLLAGGLALIMFDFFGRIDNSDEVFDIANLPDQAQRVLVPVINNGIAFAVSLASIAAVCVIIYGGYIYFASAVAEQKKKGTEIITNGIIGLIVIILAGPIVRFIPEVIRSSYSDSGGASFEFEPEPILKLVRELLGGFLIPIVGLVTVFFLVYAGYLWLTSRGDAEQVKKARQALINSLIGLVIVLLATTIVGLIVFFLQPDDFIPQGDGIEGPEVIRDNNPNDLPSIDEV